MFFDRHDAGQHLASQIVQLSLSNPVVLALPRGGVIVGLEVARVLKVPLDIIITRKIGHPFNEEFAICAITEDGERICDEKGFCGVDASWIKNESRIQQKEAQRRRKIYTPNTVAPLLTGKTVILVDDGIATGLTITAAIFAVRKQKPAKIVVAAPVAPHEVVVTLQGLVDDVVVLIDDLHFFGSVGAYYTHFPEVSDTEVIASLQEGQRLYKKQRKKV